MKDFRTGVVEWKEECTLGEPVGLDLLHLRPSSWDVRLGEARIVNEVQVDILDPKLRVPIECECRI